MKRISILILLLLGAWHLPAQTLKSKYISFSGVVLNIETAQPISNVNCRKGEAGTITDVGGRFGMSTLAGDTISFSHIGFKKYEVVVPDTLDNGEYMLAVFLSADTVQLAEVVVLPRYMEARRQNQMNARNNMQGLMKAAYAPVQERDVDMNQKAVLRDFAASTNKGHVYVGFGVGLESVNAYRDLKLQSKYKDQPTPLRYEEIDLLQKIFHGRRNRGVD